MLPLSVEYSNKRSSPDSGNSPPLVSVPRIAEKIISSRSLVSKAKVKDLTPLPDIPPNLICLATLNPPNSPTPVPVF